MNRLSLRWVILLPILAAIATGFAFFAIFIDHTDRSTRLTQIDRELIRAQRPDMTGSEVPPVSDQARSATAPDPIDFATNGVDPPIQLTISPAGAVTDARGGESPFSSSDLVDLGTTREPTNTEIRNHRVLATVRPDGQVQITALSLDGFDSATAALRRNLLVGGLVIALFESAIAWLLAARLVRPLADMAETVNKIADGALDTEIRHTAGSREVSELSADIDRMVARLREALAERERSVELSSEARNDMKKFIADVSHEIRTPLAALKGYSDLYAAGMLTETGALDRAMLRVGNESDRLHRLVNSMLDLVRDTGSAKSVVVQFDLVRIVQAVIEDLRAVHPRRVITLETIPDANKPVTGDPSRLHQAVLNLASNACTHTPESTPIAVEMECELDAVEVRVIDHGPGIDEQERTRIFLPLYRIDPSRTRGGHSGAGLGLAIAQQIALEHHGTVDVHPTPGGGATFTLRLPWVNSPGSP